MSTTIAVPHKLEHGQSAGVQRSTRIQTSGIFGFPLELILEILSYFSDHRQFIRENFYGRELHANVAREHGERSIVIRRLTMTCWPLRNLLLPLLWAEAEGCISHSRHDYETRTGGSGYGLYAQCVYLISNPTIAAYVQTFSIDLYFPNAPKDLMTKFVDCLVRLPNLKTLEILRVSSRAPVSKALKRKHAIFPSIRVLRITHASHHFIRNCPNLEDLTFTTGLDTHAFTTLRSHGNGLKRIMGVNDITVVGWGSPNLREIGIVCTTRSTTQPVEHLQQLKYLAVVNVDLSERKDGELAGAVLREAREIWKKKLVDLLKDSPSVDRKFLRWKVVQTYRRPDSFYQAYDVVETEELEVLPETSL